MGNGGGEAEAAVEPPASTGAEGSSPAKPEAVTPDSVYVEFSPDGRFGRVSGGGGRRPSGRVHKPLTPPRVPLSQYEGAIGKGSFKSVYAPARRRLAVHAAGRVV